MNTKNIIFLGIIEDYKEFYSIFRETRAVVCEDIQLYKNIITIAEDDIKKYFGNYKNIEELRETAIKYFEDFIQNKTFDINNFKDIRVTKNSKKKYKTFSADKRKLLIVPKLLEILKNSKYAASSNPYKERKDNIFRFHYFINEVMIFDIENKLYNKYNVYITIGEDNRGNLFYDLNENKKP